ncbi:MAG: 2-C-methyl-D-erythritol 4-phosphate cytidylyltransferase [Bacteroides sp.]|nr:2-C-methyl-D-erythritol 4-phosphate cytidylyltransferase [Bacteroides sp.]
MNIAVILAGGTGTRVGAKVPKQFILYNNKPILAYTVDLFQQNSNIDAIEIVCHKDWMDYVKDMIIEYNHTKVQWITNGGDTFQESVVNGILNLKDKVSKDDIVVVSFGVSPMTPQEDIDDSIRVCKEHGNAIASKDIDLCTCIKDDDYSTTQNIIRETMKGFANPWTFNYGEVLKAYETAIEKDMLKDLEPHTTSLYFALGKRLWFSQCTSANVKVTTKQDLDVFEGYLLLQEKRNNNK